MAQKKSGQGWYSRKIKFSELSESQRKVGGQVRLGNEYYTVVKIDDTRLEAYILRIGLAE